MTYIATDKHNDTDEDRIILHGTIDEASSYGREHFGMFKFIVHEYGKWRRTRDGKFNLRRITILQRIRKFRKPKKAK